MSHWLKFLRQRHVAVVIIINQTLMKSLECAQSNIVKNIMGFNKRSHHSNLLHAVRIDKVETSVIRGILSLWYRIYQVDNPARVLSDAMLCDYINSRHLIPGTLIHRVVEAGFSPIKCLSIKQQYIEPIIYMMAFSTVLGILYITKIL